MKKKTVKESITYTFFDDVFSTIVEKFPQLLIPLINEIFHTAYREDEEITTIRNEHHTKKGKLITDSYFQIGGRTYHIECQSKEDGTMVVRMLEYDFAIALDNIVETNGTYEMHFPQSGVLYLRHTESISDKLHMNLIMPDNTKISYDVPVICVQDYTKDAIFQKKLLLFLPFYVLRYEKQIEAGENKYINKWAEEYLDIVGKLDLKKIQNERALMYRTLIELINKVSKYIGAKNEDYQERMEKLMGGHILELDTDKYIIRLNKEKEEAWTEGINKGKIEGKIEGRIEGKIEEKTESILKLLEDYGTVPEGLKQKIHEEKDMETLKKWHKLAARTSSIEEFEEKIN